ncbi:MULTISPECIES: NAD(P)-dependent oxidoreductase [Amycolatopsis]|uniref:3-beta hydroxysteroid dehydrogenase n=1 Tax=Amycolatopsis bullii TaxID=941987 RepID=A0ABQ3KDB0_9PSEU|nr:NAD(P)H-binding protein [Amycolatopsis bullii]GHG13881.1 3-beta hydroxysteroid dehydrogenase [Amycolatopsis bullii]
MRITVFGAAGAVGRRVVAEALARGHEVTAVVRDPRRAADLPPEVTVRTGDAADPGDVASLARGQDLVITATRPAPGREPELVETTRSLLKGLAGTGVRLLAVGGAAGLRTPGGTTVLDAPGFPAELRPIAAACVAQHDVYRADTAVDWTYASPPLLLEPGERTGHYRLGRDDLLTDADGRSAISMEDFAIALLDEAEHPRHHRTRFTVAS